MKSFDSFKALHKGEIDEIVQKHIDPKPNTSTDKLLTNLNNNLSSILLEVLELYHNWKDE